MLDPQLPRPRAQVNRSEVHLRPDRGEEVSVTLHVRNVGRGYLAGSIDFSETIPGLEVSPARIGADGNRDDAQVVTLTLDTRVPEVGRHYRTRLMIETNGEPERIDIPVSIRVADRTRRSREATGAVLSYGAMPVAAVWVLLLHLTAATFGLGGLPATADFAPLVALDLFIFLALFAGLSCPFALLCAHRRPGWVPWVLFIAAAGLLLAGVVRAVAQTGGKTDVPLALAALLCVTVLPFLAALCGVRVLYYQSPHLPRYLAVALTVLLFLPLLGGAQLYQRGIQLASEAESDPEPVSREEEEEAQEEVKPELIVHEDDGNRVEYHLVGAEGKEVQLIFHDDCWLRVEQDGEIVEERTFTAGDDVVLQDAEKTHLRFGYPEGSAVLVNDLAVDDDILSRGGPLDISIRRRPME